MGPDSICPICKSPIDTEVCWCGGLMASHTGWEGHTAIEMGCICHYADFDWETAYQNYLKEVDSGRKQNTDNI